METVAKDQKWKMDDVDSLTAELKVLKAQRLNLEGKERADNVAQCCGLIVRINIALGKLKAD